MDRREVRRRVEPQKFEIYIQTVSFGPEVSAEESKSKIRNTESKVGPGPVKTLGDEQT